MKVDRGEGFMARQTSHRWTRWNNRSNVLYLLGTLCLVSALVLNAVWPQATTSARTSNNSPVPNCPPGYTQVKFEDPSGTQTQGPITLTVTRTEEGEPKVV